MCALFLEFWNFEDLLYIETFQKNPEFQPAIQKAAFKILSHSLLDVFVKLVDDLPCPLSIK